MQGEQPSNDGLPVRVTISIPHYLRLSIESESVEEMAWLLSNLGLDLSCPPPGLDLSGPRLPSNGHALVPDPAPEQEDAESLGEPADRDDFEEDDQVPETAPEPVESDALLTGAALQVAIEGVIETSMIRGKRVRAIDLAAQLGGKPREVSRLISTLARAGRLKATGWGWYEIVGVTKVHAPAAVSRPAKAKLKRQPKPPRVWRPCAGSVAFRILGLLAEKIYLPIAEIVACLGSDPSPTSGNVVKLKAAGYVEWVGKGQYRITHAGRAVVQGGGG